MSKKVQFLLVLCILYIMLRRCCSSDTVNVVAMYNNNNIMIRCHSHIESDRQCVHQNRKMKSTKKNISKIWNGIRKIEYILCGIRRIRKKKCHLYIFDVMYHQYVYIYRAKRPGQCGREIPGLPCSILSYYGS